MSPKTRSILQSLLIVIIAMIFLIITIVLASIYTSVSLSPLENTLENSHRTHPKYIAWKHNKAPYQPSIVLRFLNIDTEFRQSLHGKTKIEIASWFPDLRLPIDASDNQKYYHKYLGNSDFLWIGASS